MAQFGRYKFLTMLITIFIGVVMVVVAVVVAVRPLRDCL